MEFTLDVADYSAASLIPGRSLLDAVEDLMSRIHSDFTYDPEFSDIATPLSDVLEH